MEVKSNDVEVESNPFDDYDWFVINNVSKKIPVGDHLLWALIGLSAETGETLEVVEKALRKEGRISDNDLDKIEDELGDVLWYLTAVAYYAGTDLKTVLEKNITKLKARGNK